MERIHKTFMFRPSEFRFSKEQVRIPEKDPFVVLSIGERVSQTFVDRKGEVDPKWTDYLNFEGHEDSEVIVKVYENEQMLPETLFGEAKFLLRNLSFRALPQSFRMNLFKDSHKAGDIMLKFKPFDEKEFLSSTPEKTGSEDSENFEGRRSILNKVKEEVSHMGGKVGSLLHRIKRDDKNIELEAALLGHLSINETVRHSKRSESENGFYDPVQTSNGLSRENSKQEREKEHLHILDKGKGILHKIFDKRSSSQKEIVLPDSRSSLSWGRKASFDPRDNTHQVLNVNIKHEGFDGDSGFPTGEVGNFPMIEYPSEARIMLNTYNRNSEFF